MARIAAIFPNEGSQYPGMGKEFYAKSLSVRDIFDKAEKVLDRKIAKICFLGSPEEQGQLVNAHLTTFLCDYAFFDPLVQNRRKPETLTGIGVGEVAALTAAECLAYPSALQYVVKRAQLLEKFAQKHDGAALFITGVTLDQLQASLSRPEGELTITQYLAPDTFMVWGPMEAAKSLSVRDIFDKAEKV
ncbi:MAG TPA: acyltransferase domain-containing protein, partial [bacterium]|nr:acyltransferase domain-containing protein [bacterium]